MRHTQEPWRISKDEENGDRLIVDENIGSTICKRPCLEDAERIVACVNGCAGLDPAAYRECVEALRAVNTRVSRGIGADDRAFKYGKETWGKVVDKVVEALAHATGGQP